MARWEPDARGRLTQAALELYSERGFDETTVAEIAERAGLTERTFFRHFADKREAMFSGEFRDLLMKTLVNAPPSTPPLEAVVAAFEATGEVLERRGDRTRKRQALIAANPALKERELMKFATLATDMTEALAGRGVDPTTARLAVEAGTAIYRTAFDRWITKGNRRDFSELIRESLDELKAVTAGAGQTRRARKRP
jgi:AcrR family transcriptional regulator